MAYGTPRAVKLAGDGLACVPCVDTMIDNEQLTVDPYAQTENVHKLLSRNQVNGIEDTYLEGQHPDQRILEEFECSKCHKPLNKDNTDY